MTKIYIYKKKKSIDLRLLSQGTTDKDDDDDKILKLEVGEFLASGWESI